jgi:amino acid transporter
MLLFVCHIKILWSSRRALFRKRFLSIASANHAVSDPVHLPPSPTSTKLKLAGSAPSARTSLVGSPTGQVVAKFVDPRDAKDGSDDGGRPKAVLTTLTLLGVIYTASISGGYGLEDSVSAGGPLLTIVFLCIIPFVWGIPVSQCVAELACAIPSNAGPIMWINVTFAPWFTFSAVLWTAMLNAVDNSLYPTVFADYCATLLDLGPYQKAALKIGFLWLCAFINMVGVHIVGTFSVAIMLVTVLPFALMFLLQLPYGFDWERIAYVPETINWSLFLPVVSWNFSGFDSAGNVIEEVSNPNPTFIRALVLMVIAALATYIPPVLVGASAAKLKNVPFSKWGDGFWVKVGEAVGGFSMASVVMVGGTISTLGLMTTLLTTTSRSLAGMGTLNAFPGPISRWIAQYHPTYGTPIRAIIVNTTITCVLSVCLTFQVLVAMDQVLYALRLIAILLCFVRLRYSQPKLVRPYRAPGGNIAALLWGGVPILFSAFLLCMSMQGGDGLFWVSMVIVFGTMAVSVITVMFFRKDGFDGSIVEQYEDADLQTYGTILEDESEDWRHLHPHTHAHHPAAVAT